MNQTRISTGYSPRPLQDELHRRLKRFNVLVMHRRFGKTVFCVNDMIDRGANFNNKDPRTGTLLKNPRFAYLAPLYGQAKRVAWDYLKMYTSNFPGVSVNEADLRVDIPRPHLEDSIRFTLLGADNPASLKGIYLDGVILDEYAEMNPAAWREVIRPTLSDRGGWATFIGTPKGENSFYDLYLRATEGFLQPDGSRAKNEEWFGALYRASETGILLPSELESARNEMTEEEYEQEFECSFKAGLVGAYYTKELAKVEKDGRIRDVPYDDAVECDVIADLGMNDTTALWFRQNVGPARHYIDYDEESGVSIPQWCSRIKQKGYRIGKIYLPHDARARELGTGKTREEMFRASGFRTEVLPRAEIADGISAARTHFSKCYFDKVKTTKGRHALGNYQRRWDPKQNVFKAEPLHNWASNGADSFRYAAMSDRENQGSAYRRELPRKSKSEWNIHGGH